MINLMEKRSDATIRSHHHNRKLEIQFYQKVQKTIY